MNQASIQPPQRWQRFGRAAVIATGLAGLAYILLEWVVTGTVYDAALVLIVLLNTFIVYCFGFHFAPGLAEMLKGFPGRDHDPVAEIASILGHRLSVPFALAYGVLIGWGIWQVDPWGGNASLRWGLAGFVAVGSVTIGFGIFAVFRFWQVVLGAIDTMDIRILNLSRGPVTDLLRVNSQVVMITATVASLSVLAVVLANYDKDPLIVVFSIFALMLVIATYAVPVLPLSNRLRAEKSRELDRIEQLIEAHVYRLIRNDPRPDGPAKTAKLPELSALQEAQALVQSVHTLPPGGQVSVSAAGIVTVLSFLPAFIDYVVNKLLLPGVGGG